MEYEKQQHNMEHEGKDQQKNQNKSEIETLKEKLIEFDSKYKTIFLQTKTAHEISDANHTITKLEDNIDTLLIDLENLWFMNYKKDCEINEKQQIEEKFFNLKIELENIKKELEQIKHENKDLKLKIENHKYENFIESRKGKTINSSILLSKHAKPVSLDYDSTITKKSNPKRLFTAKGDWNPNKISFYEWRKDITPFFKTNQPPRPMYDINHLTIILEGPIRYCNIEETVKAYNHMCKQIILSSYVTEELVKSLTKIAPNILILNHDYEQVNRDTAKLYPPKDPKINRKGFHQFHHMYSVLPRVSTAFVLKTRADQAFSNLDYIINLMYNNDDKVVLFPYYIRGAGICKFHASDQLMGCTTRKMKQIWLPYHEIHLKNQLIEIAIWMGWMCTEAERLGYGNVYSLSPHEYGELCSKLFLVLNEKKLIPFKVAGRLNYACVKNKLIYDEKESPEKNTYKYFSGRGCDLG